MKVIIFLISAVISTTTWAMTSQEIKASVQELAVIAENGMTEYDLTGETLAAMVYSYAEQVADVEEDTEFIFNYDQVNETDEMVFGSTDANRFMNLVFSGIYYMDEESEEMYSKVEREKIKNTLKQLESTDVIYSWNPYGDSVCGTMFTTPVIIDPKAKKAYELNFYKFEGC